jgi:hypothetical protein
LETDVVAAIISGAGSLLSAGTSLIAGQTAADASNNAANLQAQTAAANAARAKPFVDIGNSAGQQLQALNTGGFNAGQPDYVGMAAGSVPNANNMGDLTATPGYQFNLQQGLQATQNSAAARGLGVSGAALKGAATYATGLADSTYQQQFANQQTKQNDYINLNTAQQGNTMNLYNRLADTAKLGANAASQVATNQTNSASAQGGYINAAGQANAAGITGVGSAISGGANNALSMNYLSNLQGNGSIYAPPPGQTSPLWPDGGPVGGGGY